MNVNKIFKVVKDKDKICENLVREQLKLKGYINLYDEHFCHQFLFILNFIIYVFRYIYGLCAYNLCGKGEMQLPNIHVQKGQLQIEFQ